MYRLVVQVNNSIQMFYIMLSLEKSLGVSNGSFTLSESNEAVYRLYRAGVMTKGCIAYPIHQPVFAGGLYISGIPA